MASPPPVTSKHYDILILLYRFRFLSRTHIQHLLEHKHHSRILTWLTFLTQNSYLTQYYVKDIHSTPSVYALTPLGKNTLKAHWKNTGTKPAAVDRIIAKKMESLEFRSHCLQVANVYLALRDQANQEGSTLHFHTQADLAGMPNLISPCPDAYVAVEKPGEETRRFFLEVFEDLPTRLLRTRVGRYLAYFDSDEWQDNTDKPFPAVVLVCPNSRLRSHLSYYLRGKTDEESSLRFFLVTQDEVREKGLAVHA
jgi:DNA-binding PadR family transcriptional regulator